MRPSESGMLDLADATILLVEDDHGDAVLIQAALDEAGVDERSVRWVRTLAEALAAPPAGVDCVLLDLGLPDASGHGVVHKMVDAAPDSAVVVLTGRVGSGAADDGVNALAAGAQDYLEKNAASGELLSRSLRYAIERKRAQRVRDQLREVRLGAAEQARLERGLLPRPLLQTERVQCATHYRPGRDDAVLGGDFYDVVELRPGVIRAVVGDVMGHGADEAALGVHLRVAWRSLLLADVPEAEMLPMLGRLLEAEDDRRARFATVCDLTIADGVITSRVAGHPAPIVLSGGRAEYLPVQVGVPLGVRGLGAAVTGWPDTTVPLPADASVLLYTDGLLDAFAAEHRGSLGTDELLAAATATPAGREGTEWIAGLLAAAPRASVDDTAIVLLGGAAR